MTSRRTIGLKRKGSDMHPTFITDLARVCLAAELSTRHEFRGYAASDPQLLRIAAFWMTTHDTMTQRAAVDDAYRMAWSIYRHIQPKLLDLCDVTAQHALEEPNHFLSTEVREKLIGKVFPDDSPKKGPLRFVPDK